MPIRHGIRVGDHLVVDDDSGVVCYASDMVTLWDGRVVHKKHFETRQPQEFVRAGTDPHAVEDARPAEDVTPPFNVTPIYVGETTVPAPYGPAAHLFDPGIGEMRVGRSFLVR